MSKPAFPAAALLLALSCAARPASEGTSSPSPSPATTRGPAPPTSPAASPPASATTARTDPSDDGGASAKAPTPRPVPAQEPRFLPHDTKCARDADCAVTQWGVDERFFCCSSCQAVAGAKAWVARADAKCAEYQRGKSLHVCPPQDCGPSGAARCDAGQCVL